MDHSIFVYLLMIVVSNMQHASWLLCFFYVGIRLIVLDGTRTLHDLFVPQVRPVSTFAVNSSRLNPRYFMID